MCILSILITYFDTCIFVFLVFSCNFCEPANHKIYEVYFVITLFSHMNRLLNELIYVWICQAGPWTTFWYSQYVYLSRHYNSTSHLDLICAALKQYVLLFVMSSLIGWGMKPYILNIYTKTIWKQQSLGVSKLGVIFPHY